MLMRDIGKRWQVGHHQSGVGDSLRVDDLLGKISIRGPRGADAVRNVQ